MRKLLIAATLLSASTTAIAATPDEACDSFARLANVVMELRQAGQPMSKMMQIAKDPMTRYIIIEAYDYPRFGTNSIAKTVIRDFSDRIHVECLRGMPQ